MPSDDDEKAEIKAGWKTTEFWLNLLVVILGALLASGAISDGGLSAQIVGGVLSALAALGYTTGRTGVKKAATLGDALKLKVGTVTNNGGAGDATEDPSKASA